jgi:hypothetical protein
MRKSQLHVLVFSSITTQIGSRMITKSLTPFVSVNEVNWRYKPIPDKNRYTLPRVIYRTIECIYWVLRIFKEIHRYQADIIIAEYAYFTGFIGAIAALISKKPCIIRAVGSDLKFDAQSLLGKGIILW